LEHANGFDRIICLCKCLNILAKNKDFNTLSSQHAVLLNQKNGDRIEKIIQYIITNYHNKISLDTISDIAGMTPPAFCYYFKKTTKKTYVTFLNEVRIGAACKKLTSTDSSIVEICYDTGFNTIANFNSQFLKINGMSPLAFRKSFKNSMPL
jgi:AraC-like DNA-binding protein